MRLLNTRTFQVTEVNGRIPTYAILSHTWGEEEVTFKDIQDLWVAKRKAGWSKVKNACAYARRYHFEWIWIDTCCIDKSSSAELSEAINSMYQYYQRSRLCIAYLCDVSRGSKTQFERSRWFTRGWTLQELIAPRYVVFLDQEWKEIGTRWSLRSVIFAITSIPVRVFEQSSTEGFSIAQKMSWAAARITTRPEDMAYCLMGIFGVNMSPIYGEGGQKAFMRLQQEIIKWSDDRSIFAWAAPSESSVKERGLFARSPSEFSISGGVSVSESNVMGDKSSFTFGNNGLHIHLPLIPQPSLGEDIFLAQLHCITEEGRYVGLYLRKLRNGQQYIRCRPEELPLINMASPDSKPQELVVKESPTDHWKDTSDQFWDKNYSIRVNINLSNSLITFVGSGNSKTLTVDLWRRFQFSVQETSETLCRTQSGEEFYIILRSMNVAEVPTVQVQLKHSIDRSGFFQNDATPALLFDTQDCDMLLLHVTGDSSSVIVEIDCIPPYTPEFFCQTWSTLQYTGSSTVTVDFNVDADDSLLFQDVFPSDIFSERDKFNRYVSLSNGNRQRHGDTHCVLAYQYQAEYGPFSTVPRLIFVVLGMCNTGSVWTDVVLSCSSSQLQIKDVWNSYLKSGSRHTHQLNGRTVALTVLDDYSSVNATIKMRTHLQLGLYTLDVQICQRQGLWEEEQNRGEEVSLWPRRAEIWRGRREPRE
ncbi:HET-domain-containing protein [Dendrothele bispora CBS 962.96]|uniref:HET-domain-containing protein n=1 Tax=Dendrothele bispora (strain CBS 962.96) TaxID=1314807 RepID=A0A4S8M0C5_DENBC|nr:HET-domain-containing protein [Dendrothele bispora CBS 962.96]